MRTWDSVDGRNQITGTDQPVADDETPQLKTRVVQDNTQRRRGAPQNKLGIFSHPSTSQRMMPLLSIVVTEVGGDDTAPSSIEINPSSSLRLYVQPDSASGLNTRVCLHVATCLALSTNAPPCRARRVAQLGTVVGDLNLVYSHRSVVKSNLKRGISQLKTNRPTAVQLYQY